MTNFPNSAQWPADFDGKVRLFPLPNLVLFPHVVQPLHIFEPRYCEMLTEALEGDGLIAMALLHEGWEKHYQCQPPIASTLCVGKILSHTPTDDGRHNILLVGMKRAKLITELDTDQTFRKAEVELLEDLYPEDSQAERPRLTAKLQDLFLKFVPDGLAAQESFQQLVGQQLPLGILTDTIAYALNLPLAVKQQLLAEANADTRCRILIRCLENQVGSGGDIDCGNPDRDETFPPKFSDN